MTGLRRRARARASLWRQNASTARALRSAFAKAAARQFRSKSETGGKGIGSRPSRSAARVVKILPHAFGFGGKGIRTPDIQLAKLALYQLSYAPGENAECRVRNAECNPAPL